MQSAGPPNQPPVKIYNAVYSSVQVYECMIRGIAVMRRRADSYVNATQILKVAGVDKGRRTKILEKEILPGKHEIVQGGYGKYQGTWIPLERGRDIAMQYGVAPLLAPLFDFTPSTNSLSALPVSAPLTTASPRPLSASSSYSSLGQSAPAYMANMPGLAPAPIMPGSALRLLNQGRAQGLFTPSTSSLAINRPGYHSPSGTPVLGYAGSPFSPDHDATPSPFQPALKRNRSENDMDTGDIVMADIPRPASAVARPNGSASLEGPSPPKRARTEPSPPETRHSGSWQDGAGSQPAYPSSAGGPPAAANGTSRVPRPSTKPSVPRNIDPTLPLKDTRRAASITAICHSDDPTVVVNILRDVAPIPPETQSRHRRTPNAHPGAGTDGADSSAALSYDIDTILDDSGHTALHIAAALSRVGTVEKLIALGADVHRGNHLGETPLMRMILSTHSYEAQSVEQLLAAGLSESIFTLDTSQRSILHHIVLLAGVKGRAVMAKYYLDQIVSWIARKENKEFSKLIDLQDEHGDTALNIAARVGNRALVRTLLELGAKKVLMNKLGLRPGDFGVESEALSGGPKSEDIMAMLRAVQPAPLQKANDVIADMSTMISGLSSEFQAEIKTKQDALDVTQAHLRAATRELSEQRRQIQAWQGRCAELDMTGHRVKNLERAIEEEDQFDWTGRTNASGAPTTHPAFRYRGPSSTTAGISPTSSSDLEPDPPLPLTNDLQSLVRLRRLKLWHTREEEVLAERLAGLKGANAEKEFMCKKIVSLCTGLPVDKIDDMLTTLIVSLESENQNVDIGRVAGFMQKVRDGVI